MFHHIIFEVKEPTIELGVRARSLFVWFIRAVPCPYGSFAPFAVHAGVGHHQDRLHHIWQ
jgi:hypothetical protein